MRHTAMAVVASLLLTHFGGGSTQAEGREPIRLANDPALSPDGSTLVFSWAGDLWSVSSGGGRARPLTRSTAIDRQPVYSPDGKRLAFVSDRAGLGALQPYVMPAEGGVPRQVGFHSAGYTLEGWDPDGRSLLVSGPRDHFWRDADRFFRVRVDQRTAEVPLFDTYGRNGQLSPDGRRLLFTREGDTWWRKGYKGSRDSQIWLFDLETKGFQKVLDPPGGALWPLWRADGKGFHYVGLHQGALNLREHDLEKKADRPLTTFKDDSVVFPAISRDGSTIVFRNLFDLYLYRPGKDEAPRKLEVWNEGDPAREPTERRILSQASQAAFSRDGLEIAVIAGGDLWVMDTELKEPRQVTDTPWEERDPEFSPSGDAILYVSDQGDRPDIWRATRADTAIGWWQNATFELDRLTNDPANETAPRFSPDGKLLAFVKGLGDLIIATADGKDPRRLAGSFSTPRFDWSPDGRWMVYTLEDDDHNDDVWIAPLDGSRPAENLTRNPRDEGEPVWSPDGRTIAFNGRRQEGEVDLFFVYLQAGDEEKSTRDRSIEKAVEKFKAARKKGATPKNAGDQPADKDKDEDRSAREAGKRPAPTVTIDFEGLHDRIRRVSIPNSIETGLVWSADSKKLAFVASIDGKRGAYTIEPPDDLKPKPLSETSGSQARWLAAGDQIVWLAGGVPASLSASGKATTYPFRARQTVDVAGRFRAGFDLSWRIMRDQWYDDRHGNRDWDAVRDKYADAAAGAPDVETFATVVNLMLGELNGSHLGFRPGRAGGPTRSPDEPSGSGSRWSESTAHLGLRFDPAHKGPGLKVRDVVPGSPAHHRATRIAAGELVLEIDGKAVDPTMDLTLLLNGPLDRDIRLKVQAADGTARQVELRPISYRALPALLYDKWVKGNRARVAELSKGRLGYLHIRGMDFVSFARFEEDLFNAASGKAGLIIDVRENGGGSTTDHLLTALTQPTHAITVPRGGGPGYPQDRRVYATWSKPIVVLCNQNSFSNAEIFSHAVKTLKRGALVGVPTAGGVLSTGSAGVMDLGSIRLPTRGWFILGTGEDMELNGAVPDHILWPDPADFARNIDAQLMKGVQVLLTEVVEAEQKPRPHLRKATERGGQPPAR